MTKTYIDELAEEIARLREENKRLKDSLKNVSDECYIEKQKALLKINKLAGLLEECREFLIVYLEDGEIAINNVCTSQIIDKIDEVLK